MHNHLAFWELHERRKAKGFYSEEFKSFFIKTVHAEPGKRPTIEELLSHSWLQGSVPSLFDVQREIIGRLRSVSRNLEYKDCHQRHMLTMVLLAAQDESSFTTFVNFEGNKDPKNERYMLENEFRANSLNDALKIFSLRGQL